jgi:Protein of unknown function (DUF3987)
MAKLAFSAQTEPLINLTFGRSKSEIRWADRRSISWSALAQMLATAAVGQKDGACYTPATFSGVARRMDQATQIDVAVLDSDTGHTLEQIRAAIKAKGWAAIIHSTYSHLTNQTIIAAEPADKWLAANPGADIADYLRTKRGYLPNVIANCTLLDEIREGTLRSYVIQHNPCAKFRIILPLQTPWLAEEYQSQQAANAVWRERIGALSHALGLETDQSCTDTSRLFYLPRHRPNAEYVCEVIEGRPCPIWDLPDIPPALAPTLTPAPATAKPTAIKNNHLTFQARSGEWVDLTDWAAAYGPRFEILTALKARAPQLIAPRRSGVKQHIVCPHTDSHVTGQTDTTGTYVVNTSDLPNANLPSITSGFVIHCMHNGCSGRDRLNHLHKLLCDEALTIPDLTNPTFLIPEPPRIDASAILRSKAKQPIEDVHIPPDVNEGSNITPDLYSDLPGALAMILNYIMETSVKPQPALALGASLAFGATVVGQRVKLQQFGIRPNIYVLSIAHSGAGKDRPQKALKQMAQEAGLSNELIGVEEFASDAGLINSIAQYPRQLILPDEVSGILGVANQRNASPHLANIPITLLKLYSSSNSFYKTKAYADTEKVKIINQPSVSFLGSCTPTALFDSLTTRQITSGLLSRMMLFDAGDRDPQINRQAVEKPVPAEIIDWIRAWDAVSPIKNVVARVGGEEVIEPRIVVMTQDAYAMALAFEEEMHKAKLIARQDEKDALFVRAFENALKFALIAACAKMPVNGAIDENNLCVDTPIMDWAIRLSRATVYRMEAGSKEIVDTEFAKNIRSVVKFIRAGGPKGKTTRDIGRVACGKHPKKMMDDIYANISSSGDAKFLTKIRTKTKLREAWVHRDFLGEHGNDEADLE